MKRMLITGGAGFVGSNLALYFKQAYPKTEIICLDNLSRTGSELNLPRLRDKGIVFVHGDVRNPEDLQKISAVDWLIECSAEPSVHAGYGESPAYCVNTNLIGLWHCLEFLRIHGGNLIFLSSSRVYPIGLLRNLPLAPTQNRFNIQLNTTSEITGVSEAGISEKFSLEGVRSLYGATKLCAELLIQEYRQMYGIKALINRCGVIAGPWQMGKVDQGFVALWVARHLMGKSLSYMGFGGEGLQVRDVLHIYDLYALIEKQMMLIEQLPDPLYNIGGGLKNSTSLRELTEMVSNITDKKCTIHSDPNTREADIPYYVTDITKAKQEIGWEPQKSLENIVGDVTQWMHQHAVSLKNIFSI